MEPQHIVSIDEIEFHSRKIVNIEAGEGSSSHDQPATTREKRIKTLMDAEAEMKAVQEAKIQKVIFLLRDHKHFVKYFEPRVASLGPIHHGKPKYELGEKYKRILAYKFIQGCCGAYDENNFYEHINCLYEKIKKEIKDLRECFEEKVTTEYDDESLAWILFVDGCAILQYIFWAANDKFKDFHIKIDSAAFAQQDLFLLENQVPYRLLKSLMSSSGKENELRRSIDNFIRNVTYQQTESQEKVNEEREPTHLLDLLRTKLLGPLTQSSIPIGPKPSSRKMCRKKKDQDQDWQLYRNVQELKAAGIQLKCGDSHCLKNISFGRRSGSSYTRYLWLPPITVDDSTGPKFMNLIAYEWCPDFENDCGITSYVSFLDSLINEPGDVKDLKKAHVLRNVLGKDQEVAELFNEIGTDLVPNPETYKDVKIQIQAYCKNNISYILFKLKTWIAEVIRVHFSSPWAIVGLLAASSALVLTAIQTWYTVYSPPGPCDDFCLHRP
ncbi:UPF0481 protein At3g47200-like [Alnus glutinosa]|uniref:UPF0481 protein At3g47200-like n=1 Tax=Alnus glutinosa TaxID=3517 RepID=UPI002D79B80F|nr:UPF0481 protein At3g47200-like [Alnus glutinosa]